jgi:hypothetical protein
MPETPPVEISDATGKDSIKRNKLHIPHIGRINNQIRRKNGRGRHRYRGDR